MHLGDYSAIAFSSIAVYIFIIAAIRIFGKKELSQLSVIDLVFILLISNAVQNAMVGSNTTLTGGLVAAAALFLVNFLLKQVIYKFPRLGRAIQGEPLMLIYKGKVNRRNLSKSRITLEELQESVREHGVALVEDVDLAVLEADGNISIVSDDFQQRTTKKRLPRKRTGDRSQ